jgi:hypothetical protein
MDNTYQDKMNDYINSINNLMFTFEITKCCNYSTFINIYKDESLMDLYKKVAIHFSCEVVELYFITPQSNINHVPFSNIPVFKFVKDNITCNPIRLNPIYPLPNPVVYRLYLNDGYSHDICPNTNIKDKK